MRLHAEPSEPRPKSSRKVRAEDLPRFSRAIGSARPYANPSVGYAVGLARLLQVAVSSDRIRRRDSLSTTVS